MRNPIQNVENAHVQRGKEVVGNCIIVGAQVAFETIKCRSATCIPHALYFFITVLVPRVASRKHHTKQFRSFVLFLTRSSFPTAALELSSSWCASCSCSRLRSERCSLRLVSCSWLARSVMSCVRCSQYFALASVRAADKRLPQLASFSLLQLAFCSCCSIHCLTQCVLHHPNSNGVLSRCLVFCCRR